MTRYKPRALVPGLALTAAIAVVAWLLAKVIPLLGAPVIAILLGLAVSAVRRPTLRTGPGIAFSSSVLLQLAIVLLGTTLALGQVLRVGARSLPVMLGTLAVALAGAAVIGRLLAVSPRLRALIGVGTGICGASAIAAIAGIVEATSAEVAYAISTIFVFNIVAVVLFPALGHLFHLSQHGFGLWAGKATDLHAGAQIIYIVIAGAGMGLMLGVEFVEGATNKPAPELRDRVEVACFERGLIILGAGANTIRW